MKPKNNGDVEEGNREVTTVNVVKYIVTQNAYSHSLSIYILYLYTGYI